MRSSRSNGSLSLSAPIGFHVTMRLEDDRPLATTVAAQRGIARVVLTHGRRSGLLAFGSADNHLHIELATGRPAVGDFVRHVACALKWVLRLGARFEPARILPIDDQRHAYNTFHYAHRQDARHLLELDRAREATSLPDLLGLRVVEPSLAARVRASLPRIRREELLAQFPRGVFDTAVMLDFETLASAAAAALALPDLVGRSVDVVRARRAAVHAAGSRADTRRLSESLAVTQRTVQQLRLLPREPLLVRAVELQLLLRQGLRERQTESTTDEPFASEARGPHLLCVATRP
jgi:hypothetical protein